ncbi:hypothetical protein P3875_06750 [Myroides sp. JBRI-B21084]|uniref:hypothetical protein n=1 Tax=Myroides sp. JBRI-B21084 TaxID=3119977 RepID=UPI0026E40466|nr:hypothetical protein [Paenimyroides cloacae]WKW45485.1 hypothetical protein P3875_06750 [Paenimyroides cloacae]
MDELTIPYHLAIPTFFCIVGLLTILLKRKTLFANNKLLWTSITIFLCLYLLIVGTAMFDSIYYQWDLNRYDLDKDGMFGGKELTNEQNEAMRKITSDTGRNFAFITGFIFALTFSATIFICGFVIKKVRRKNE